MTFDQWVSEYHSLEARARDYENSVATRAKAAFDAAFGKTEHFQCFMFAHNWEGQSWLTPAQNKACRLVRYLDHKRWEASRLVDRITHRHYRTVSRW